MINHNGGGGAESYYKYTSMDEKGHLKNFFKKCLAFPLQGVKLRFFPVGLRLINLFGKRKVCIRRCGAANPSYDEVMLYKKERNTNSHHHPTHTHTRSRSDSISAHGVHFL